MEVVGNIHLLCEQRKLKKESIETALPLDNARSFRGVQEKIKDFILQLS
jgi:hypothetical protein